MTSVRTIKALWHLWRENVRRRLQLADPPRQHREIEEHDAALLAALCAEARSVLSAYPAGVAEGAVSAVASTLRRHLQLDEPGILRTEKLCKKTALPADVELQRLVPSYRDYLRHSLASAAPRLGRATRADAGPGPGSTAPPPPTPNEVQWLVEALEVGTAPRRVTEYQKQGFGELVRQALGHVQRDDVLAAERAKSAGRRDQAHDKVNQRHSRVRARLVRGIRRLESQDLIPATLAERLRAIVREHFRVVYSRRKPVSGGDDARSGGHHG